MSRQERPSHQYGRYIYVPPSRVHDSFGEADHCRGIWALCMFTDGKGGLDQMMASPQGNDGILYSVCVYISSTIPQIKRVHGMSIL